MIIAVWRRCLWLFFTLVICHVFMSFRSQRRLSLSYSVIPVKVTSFVSFPKCVVPMHHVTVIIRGKDLPPLLHFSHQYHMLLCVLQIPTDETHSECSISTFSSEMILRVYYIEMCSDLPAGPCSRCLRAPGRRVCEHLKPEQGSPGQLVVGVSEAEQNKQLLTFSITGVLIRM